VATQTTGRTDLLQTANHLRITLGRIVRRLRQAHAPGEVTLSELSVLGRLDRQGIQTAGQLAEQERVTPQAMSTILAELEARELIARTADSEDGRKLKLTATEAGRQLLAGRRSETAGRVAAALDTALTAAEQRQLIEALPLLDRLAEHL
jgi:DNA-binding MarR family transcriptional regulator